MTCDKQAIHDNFKKNYRLLKTILLYLKPFCEYCADVINRDKPKKTIWYYF